MCDSSSCEIVRSKLFRLSIRRRTSLIVVQRVFARDPNAKQCAGYQHRGLNIPRIRMIWQLDNPRDLANRRVRPHKDSHINLQELDLRGLGSLRLSRLGT